MIPIDADFFGKSDFPDPGVLKNQIRSEILVSNFGDILKQLKIEGLAFRRAPFDEGVVL